MLKSHHARHRETANHRESANKPAQAAGEAAPRGDSCQADCGTRDEKSASKTVRDNPLLAAVRYHSSLLDAREQLIRDLKASEQRILSLMEGGPTVFLAYDNVIVSLVPIVGLQITKLPTLSATIEG